MTDQPTRCPLCCGQLYEYDGGGPVAFCNSCGLTSDGWPRIAELVAIRDAAVEFYRGSTATPMRFAAAMGRLFELTRQEAEKGANDVRSR